MRMDFKNFFKKIMPNRIVLWIRNKKEWRLIFRHSGWMIESDKIYLQYPKRSLLGFLMKGYWVIGNDMTLKDSMGQF